MSGESDPERRERALMRGVTENPHWVARLRSLLRDGERAARLAELARWNTAARRIGAAYGAQSWAQLPWMAEHLGAATERINSVTDQIAWSCGI
mgnify:CR=1 FL=1